MYMALLDTTIFVPPLYFQGDSGFLASVSTVLDFSMTGSSTTGVASSIELFLRNTLPIARRTELRRLLGDEDMEKKLSRRRSMGARCPLVKAVVNSYDKLLGGWLSRRSWAAWTCDGRPTRVSFRN
jgi:hypothetical protein